MPLVEVVDYFAVPLEEEIDAPTTAASECGMIDDHFSSSHRCSMNPFCCLDNLSTSVYRDYLDNAPGLHDPVFLGLGLDLDLDFNHDHDHRHRFLGSDWNVSFLHPRTPFLGS